MLCKTALVLLLLQFFLAFGLLGGCGGFFLGLGFGVCFLFRFLLGFRFGLCLYFGGFLDFCLGFCLCFCFRFGLCFGFFFYLSFLCCFFCFLISLHFLSLGFGFNFRSFYFLFRFRCCLSFSTYLRFRLLRSFCRFLLSVFRCLSYSILHGIFTFSLCSLLHSFISSSICSRQIFLAVIHLSSENVFTKSSTSKHCYPKVSFNLILYRIHPFLSIWRRVQKLWFEIVDFTSFGNFFLKSGIRFHSRFFIY